MIKNNKIKIDNNKFDYTIENIKLIEEQIKIFKKNKPFFFQKKKLEAYNERIEKLEHTRKTLYKSVEYKLDNN